MSKLFLFLVPALLAAAVLSACGGDGDGNLAGNEADAAFVADMIPHHEGAVMMAMMAKQRAERPELDAMADEIIAAQEKEISEMRSLQAELPEVETDDAGAMMMGEDHLGHTGIDAEAMGRTQAINATPRSSSQPGS